MDYRVISIGAPGAHSLRGEKGIVRTPHATTTLITSDDLVILVDPSLPPQALGARLEERSGLNPESVTHVFLTSFRPDLRRGLPLFEHAVWWIAEREREAVGGMLIEQFQRAEDELQDEEIASTIRQEIALLKRCQSAPDKLAAHVDLFPLPGVTPGLAGLLLSSPRHTVLVCGDAIATAEHLEKGQVLAECVDIELAQESFSEVVEIADLIIPGRDNILVNPMRRPF